MDVGYEAYCLCDPIYFDSPARKDATAGTGFAEAAQPLPEGWGRATNGFWTIVHPPEGTLPAQGWKIHISATRANAARIVSTAWRYCLTERLAFKFLPGMTTWLAQNGKGAQRGSSGKLVTIYPLDEPQLERTLMDLGEILRGEEGPYVLSDLRWEQGPLYVRYGGFLDLYCWESGEPVPAIRDAGGRLVPDPRKPVFDPPPWVPLPQCLVPHLGARNQVTVADLPYHVDRPLHFSNGGGVYLATNRRTGRQVVLKEARPHAGVDATGATAVDRLERERNALEKLAGLSCVPALLDHFSIGGHRFLVLEYAEGETIHTRQAVNHPLLSYDPGADQIARYTEWALSIHRAVDEAVASIHDRGLVIRDLHPHNIIVDDANGVHVVDFELAGPPGDEPGALGVPGYAAPPDRTGYEIDDYALAALRIGLFLPITPMLAYDPAKPTMLASEVRDRFPVPAGFLNDGLRVLRTRTARPARRFAGVVECLRAGGAGWEELRDAIASAILAAATPERHDRLFPGDIAQFGPGGAVNLANGAAGVLYALAVSGAGTFPEHEDWLVAATRRTPLRPGLLDGLQGIVHALWILGRTEDALSLLDRSLSQRWEELGANLHSGLAGIGLSLDHLADETGDASLFEAAAGIADLVASHVREAGPGSEHAGLLHGGSGPALLLTRWYERTGDDAFLDLAALALRRELDRCVTNPDGTLHVKADFRLLSYLNGGTAGIGYALDAYLSHRDDVQFTEARAAILRVTTAGFVIQPGLFNGRAGLLLYLARQDDPALADAVAQHVRTLAWHAVPRDDGIAFPGETLARLSTDLASGAAGVLLTLARAHGQANADLPLLTRSSPGPARRPVTPPECHVSLAGGSRDRTA